MPVVCSCEHDNLSLMVLQASVTYDFPFPRFLVCRHLLGLVGWCMCQLKGLYLYVTVQIQKLHSSMPWVMFEPTNTMFQVIEEGTCLTLTGSVWLWWSVVRVFSAFWSLHFDCSSISFCHQQVAAIWSWSFFHQKNMFYVLMPTNDSMKIR